MTKKDGGQAFPVPAANSHAGNMFYPETGMTLRDWYAGLAMQGMYAHHVLGRFVDYNGDTGGYAEAAFLMADAMIAEREKTDD
jgi:hypothetical protein